tara:strand:+ start:9308 stop:11425 length:2118 start_codon:yes stop_codon:yes gene_type:complete
MRTLQLYIGGQRVDLFKDEKVQLTQTIKNVKDISKVFTEFTKTFAVPASSVNNKIFEHYYNSEIINGFDARVKRAATLELNDLPFKEGTIRLEGVDLKNNMPHTYRITFFGNTVNLKDIFADEQLSNLQFSTGYNREYSFSKAVQDFSIGYAQTVLPLITHTDRMFYNTATNSNVYGNVYPSTGNNPAVPNGIKWNQFKYAVRVLNIVGAIANTYNITFSNDFFNFSNLNGIATLYMWLNRKSGAVTQTAQVEAVYTLLTDLSTNNQNLNGSSVSQGALTINTPSSPGVFYLNVGAMQFTITPVNQSDTWGIQVLRDGVVIRTETQTGGPYSFSILPGQNGILDNRTYTFRFTSTTNVAFQPNSIFIRINYQRIIQGQSPQGEVDDWDNDNIFQTNQNQEFNISEQMPKMKVIDFLSGLFKMYNLIAYVEDNIIVVKTLDEYYAASTNVYNIDKYLDTEKSTTDVALPFNKINFSYKGLGTILAKQFEQLNNTGWGSMAFTLDGGIYDAPSEPYEVEVPFEHMMYERLYDANPLIIPAASTEIQWGFSVNENQQPYIGSPLLFYGVIQENATPIRILDTAQVNNGTTITEYMIPSNSFRLDPSINKHNLHFQNELNEYLANEPNSPSNDFTDTLFESEYKKYIQGVFDNSMRLKKVTAYLPMKIYYNLQLNDLIEMNQQTYKINSLSTDLTTGKTEFELLNNIIL